MVHASWALIFLLYFEKVDSFMFPYCALKGILGGNDGSLNYLIFLFPPWEECEQLCFPLATTTTICKNKNHCNLIIRKLHCYYVRVFFAVPFSTRFDSSAFYIIASFLLFAFTIPNTIPTMRLAHWLFRLRVLVQVFLLLS